MRRMILVLAVLFVGCAKSEPPASESTSTETAAATLSLADLAGTWDGTATAAGSDTVLTNIELTATEDPAGWSMTVTNAKNPAMTKQVSPTSVVAAGDSVVVEAGPFESVLREGQQVSTHTVYHLQDGNLIGTIVATYPASGDAIVLHSVATRRAAQ